MRDDETDYRKLVAVMDKKSCSTLVVMTQWILPNYASLTQEAYDYFKSLIVGEPALIMKDGVFAYVKSYPMK